MLVEAYGNRIFDYSWIFGPIRYKARFKQNGEVKAEISSESENYSEGIDLEPDTDTEACGFYGYESGQSQSNEYCYTFRTPKEEKKEDPEPTPTPEATPTPTPEATPTPEPTQVPEATATPETNE